MKTAYLNIGELAVMDGKADFLHHMGVLVENGSITAISNSREIEALLSNGDRRIDVQGRLVTPALVDSHTHACFAGDRADEWERRAGGATYQEIAAMGGGILSSVRSVRNAAEEELAKQTQKHLRWMKNSGTGVVEVKSGYGLDLENELKMLRATRKALQDIPHRLTFLGAHAVPPEAESRSEYLETAIQMLPAMKGIADYADMFVESGYFTPDDCRKYAKAVQASGLKLRLHVDQMEDGDGALLAAEVGAVSADHLEHTNERGMIALAQANVFAGLLPASVYGLRLTKYPDARKMIDFGVRVVLATDFNPGSSPSPSLSFCMSLAVNQMGMTATEALRACTITAAQSLDLEDRHGSIEVGKAAQLLQWDVESHRELPYWVGARLLLG